MSVLRRPHADGADFEFGHLTAEALGQLRVGQQFDTLCVDGRHYIAEIVSLTKPSIVNLHFPFWAKSFDFTGHVSELYMAPLGTYSAPVGLNPARNR